MLYFNGRKVGEIGVTNIDELCEELALIAWNSEPKNAQTITEAISLLKEQEVAYQGAEELLRQKTILFDDAIKRLKEQEAEIRQLRLALDIAKGTCNGIKVERPVK